ncbi:hypothetical protein W822_20140 [Advenella kashmirensis W13003]|uniref:Uncharacterized protein n=1 Tax=Advenella kashmirensis W13003 TaxID=1424334 RepID=V8QLV9_9BURK|nr:hypothetical protein W822_20140 [Advenella kashmirensis W13003]
MRGTVALDARLAYEVIKATPDIYAFNRLVDSFNMMSVAMLNDKRFELELNIYGGATRALDEARTLIAAGVQLPARLLEPIRIGVNVIDEVLPRLDLAYLANSELTAVNTVKDMMRN